MDCRVALWAPRNDGAWSHGFHTEFTRTLSLRVKRSNPWMTVECRVALTGSSQWRIMGTWILSHEFHADFTRISYGLSVRRRKLKKNVYCFIYKVWTGWKIFTKSSNRSWSSTATRRNYRQWKIAVGASKCAKIRSETQWTRQWIEYATGY